MGLPCIEIQIHSTQIHDIHSLKSYSKLSSFEPDTRNLNPPSNQDQESIKVSCMNNLIFTTNNQAGMYHLTSLSPRIPGVQHINDTLESQILDAHDYVFDKKDCELLKYDAIAITRADPPDTEFPHVGDFKAINADSSERINVYYSSDERLSMARGLKRKRRNVVASLSSDPDESVHVEKAARNQSKISRGSTQTNIIFSSSDSEPANPSTNGKKSTTYKIKSSQVIVSETSESEVELLNSVDLGILNHARRPMIIFSSDEEALISDKRKLSIPTRSINAHKSVHYSSDDKIQSSTHERIIRSSRKGRSQFGRRSKRPIIAVEVLSNSEEEYSDLVSESSMNTSMSDSNPPPRNRLYCHRCKSLQSIDNFSRREQVNPKCGLEKRVCLIHCVQNGNTGNYKDLIEKKLSERRAAIELEDRIYGVVNINNSVYESDYSFE